MREACCYEHTIKVAKLLLSYDLFFQMLSKDFRH